MTETEYRYRVWPGPEVGVWGWEVQTRAASTGDMTHFWSLHAEGVGAQGEGDAVRYALAEITIEKHRRAARDAHSLARQNQPWRTP